MLAYPWKFIGSKKRNRSAPANAAKRIRNGTLASWFFALCVATSISEVRGAEIWVCVNGPTVRPDFHALFRPDAPWSNAAGAVRVVKISLDFAGATSEERLHEIFSELRRRNILLAMEGGMVTAADGCGRGEGYSAPGTVVRIAERIRRAGGDLRYMAMDEPLWFAHARGGATACRTPIPKLARNVAVNVNLLKEVFPAVQIGDIEPFGMAQRNGWSDEIMEWTQEYKGAVGEPLAFFHLDMIWSGSWHPQVSTLAIHLHKSGINFGVIYNGDPDDQADLAWTRHAEQRFVAVEADPALTPDHAILQSWMPHPSHMLPETQPGSKRCASPTLFYRSAT